MEIEFVFKNARSGNNKRYFNEFAVHGPSSKGQILMRREVSSIKYKKCDESLGKADAETKFDEKNLF